MDHDASAANFWELYGVAALVSWNQEPVNESSRRVYLLPLYRLVNTLPSLFLRSRYSLSFSVCSSKILPAAVGHPRSGQDVHMVPELFGTIMRGA